MCWQYKMRSNTTPDAPPGPLPSFRQSCWTNFAICHIFHNWSVIVFVVSLRTKVACDFNESLNKDVGQNACISVTIVVLQLFLRVFAKEISQIDSWCRYCCLIARPSLCLSICRNSILMFEQIGNWYFPLKFLDTFEFSLKSYSDNKFYMWSYSKQYSLVCCLTVVTSAPIPLYLGHTI